MIPVVASVSYPAISATGYSNGAAVNISPSVTEGNSTFTISPALPAGLTFNATSGAISGSYTAATGVRDTYTITVTNSAGSASTSVALAFYGKAPTKTGQTTCFDTTGNIISCAGTGQDGEYQAGLANSYSAPTQHPTFTNDYTTTDSNGLIWKTCTEGLSGANCGTGGMYRQTYLETNKCTNLNSLNNGSGYAGKTGWRLPTPNELDRWVIQYSLQTGMSAFFPGLQIPPGGVIVSNSGGDNFCSNSLNADRAMSYNSFTYSFGMIFHSYKCVSGSNTDNAPLDVDNGDGTATDLNTGLTWQKCSYGVSGSDCKTGTPTLMNWTDAVNACKNLTLNGRTWKLPNINEAMSFYKRSDVITWNLNIFPTEASGDVATWSSTTNTASPGQAYGSYYVGSRVMWSKTLTKKFRCVSSP